jgi:hypothetical protein
MTVVQDNLDRLAAFPLDAIGSVSADNIEKLRNFSADAQRRLFTTILFDDSGSHTIDRRDRRAYSTVLIP